MAVQQLIPTFFTLLSVFLTGGPNDLLGYLSTDAYWKAKGVNVSVAQLLRDVEEPRPEDISKLIADLSADDPAVRDKAGARILAVGPGALPQLQQAMNDPNAETAARSKALVMRIRDESKALSIRRLMAIRTLGEMKSNEALSALRTLLDSKTPFVADYATLAIAAIEGKHAAPSTQPALSIQQRLADVNLLPGKIDMVGQVASSGGAPVIGFEQILHQLPFDLPADRRRRAVDQSNRRLLKAAELLGNIRVDCVTLGWFTGPVNQPGYAVIVGRGQYDSKAAADALRKAQVESKLVDGIDVFMLDEDTALLLPDDHLAVLIPAEQNGELPVEQTVAALHKGAGDFATNADLANLVKATDTTRPLWLVTKVNDGLRQVIDVLGPFNIATVTASRNASGDPTDVRLEAVGTDPAKVKSAVEAAFNVLRQTVQEGRQEMKVRTLMKPYIRFMEGISLSADGPKATATGKITWDALLPLLMDWNGVRFELDAGR